jgi:predicted AAA+ superfamily ATPase
MKALCLTLLSEFHDKLNAAVIVPRQALFTTLDNKIKVAIGMRRTGKTYFLYQQIKSLLEQGIDLSRILFIDFEDDRLKPWTQSRFVGMVDAFYQLYPDNHNKPCYLFFDEIQNVEDWAVVVRRLQETRQVQLYLTGSSAKLLSKEIATSLRGRSLPTEIWPYSYREFCEATDVALPQKLPLTQKMQDQHLATLSEYLAIGGLPEVVKLDVTDRCRVLQDYVNVVIFRDIVERHNVSNVTVLQYMVSFLLKNVGCSFAVNQLFNTLKSQGFSIGRATLYEYLAYIEDAYLAFSVPLFSDSVRKTNVNPKKSYAIYTGLAQSYTLNRSKNMGHAFENLIYLDLRRAEREIFYCLTNDRYEIDFLTKSITGDINLYQVCWDVSDKDTLAREMRALEAAEQELGVKGMLVTPDNYLEFIAALFS